MRNKFTHTTKQMMYTDTDSVYIMEVGEEEEVEEGEEMHEISRTEHQRGLWTDIVIEPDEDEIFEIVEENGAIFIGGAKMRFDYMMAEGLDMMEGKHMGKRIDFLRALTQGKEQAICSYLLESFGTLPTREMMQELIRCIDECDEHGMTMTAEQARQVAAWQVEEATA